MDEPQVKITISMEAAIVLSLVLDGVIQKTPAHYKYSEECQLLCQMADALDAEIAQHTS